MSDERGFKYLGGALAGVIAALIGLVAYYLVKAFLPIIVSHWIYVLPPVIIMIVIGFFSLFGSHPD